MNEQIKAGNRRQLIVMLLIVGASLGGSYALYRAANSGGVWSTTNNGEFVDPPVNSAALDLVDSAGLPLGQRKTWWLWVVRTEPCDQACAHALHQLRQLHILLNRDTDRVKRALVTQAPVDRGDLEKLYPELAFLTGKVEALPAGIYIVDPLGNLVMHYPLEAAGKPVLEDLQRLLKVSQIG